MADVFKKARNRLDGKFDRFLIGCEDNFEPRGLSCLDEDDLASACAEDDDTVYSILSESSMATTNNNPGPGRVLDTYFYQPSGRRLERWIKSAVHKFSPAFDVSGSAPEATDNTDNMSISTVSTMATFDDLPGTGRIIDKHFYQPTGRRIERLAVRITFPFLTPGAITHRISGLITQSYFLPRIDVRSQGAILYDISKATFWDGRTVVVGLESLIRQTRSKSTYRCAAALSGLIRLSANHFLLVELYTALTRSDSDIQLSNLTNTLNENDPLKKYLSLLSALAQSTLLLSQNHRPTPQRAKFMKQTLLMISKRRQYGIYDLFTAISDAFNLFAEGTASILALDMDDKKYDDPVMDENVEATMLISIFLIRSLVNLWNEPCPADSRVSQYHRLLVYTYIHWVNKTLSSVIWAFSELSTRSLDTAQLVIALRGPFLVFPVLQQLFPDCVSYSRALPVVYSAMFPRRVRAGSKKVPAPFEELTVAVTRMTVQLLLSKDELERETRKSLNKSMVERRKGTIAHCDQSLACTLESAQAADVATNNLTREFLLARKRMERETWETQVSRWSAFRWRCRARHSWDQYFRSDLDWDSDTSSLLHSLFSNA